MLPLTEGSATVFGTIRLVLGELLLPKETASLSDISPKFFRNHVVVADGENLVTLSGLRGVNQESVPLLPCL